MGVKNSQPNPFHFILREPLLGTIVELGRTRALVCGHFLRVFERAAVGEIGGDPGRAKRVAADFLSDAGTAITLPDLALDEYRSLLVDIFRP